MSTADQASAVFPRRAAAAGTYWPVALRVWLCALLFLLSHSPAALECGPLKRADSNLFGPIRHEHGLLWRISAPDGGDSVMLGTMHVADPRVLAIAATAQPHIAAARALVVEVELDRAAIGVLQDAMFYADGRSLRDVVSAALFNRTAAALRPYGLAPEIVARMKPWAAFTTLSLPAGQSGLALDLVLADAARSAGKPVIELESVAEQIAVFDAVGEADQIEILREAACHHALLQRETEAMIEFYAARDLAGLAARAVSHTGQHGVALLEALLWQRNERMLERLRPVLAQGGVFVAVGALHLPGTRGLLEGLEREGYRVEALY